MSKAIHINAKEQKIEQIEILTLKDMQKSVGGLIEPVPVEDPNGDRLYVDEEGLFKGYNYGFILDGREYTGNGLISRTKGSDQADCKATIQNIKERLGWIKPRQ